MHKAAYSELLLPQMRLMYSQYVETGSGSGKRGINTLIFFLNLYILEDRQKTGRGQKELLRSDG